MQGNPPPGGWRPANNSAHAYPSPGHRLPVHGDKSDLGAQNGEYGATSPELTPPLTSNKKIHYKGLSCSPCFEKICKYGHYNCLVEIQADDVFKSFK